MSVGTRVAWAGKAVSFGVAWPFRLAGRTSARAVNGTVRLAAKAWAGLAGSLQWGWISLTRGVLAIGRAIKRSILRFIRAIRHAALRGGYYAARPFVMTSLAAKVTVFKLGRAVKSAFQDAAFRLRKTTTTLSIEDGEARVLVFKGDRIIDWRRAPVAAMPEALAAPSTGGDADEEARPVSPLGALTEGLRVSPRRVIVDLPLYVPLLRYVRLPNLRGRYLKEVLNAEIMETVPFDASELDLSWRIQKDENGRHAFVVAVPRSRMDAQVRIIRDSNLAPGAAYPKAAALAMAVGRPDVFILHLSRSQAAIVMVRGGSPRIVHQMELSDPSKPDDQAEAIAMAVAQVSGYHRTQFSEDDDSTLGVVLTGELKGSKSLTKTLRAKLGRQVEPFHSEIGCPAGLPAAEYAVNIGLYAAGQGKGKPTTKDGPKMNAALNVLPQRHRPRPLPVVPAVVFSALLAAGFLAYSATGWVSEVAGEVGRLAATVDIREDQAREYRLTIARKNALDGRIAEAESQSVQLEATLGSLKTQMDALLARLSLISTLAAESNVVLGRLIPQPEGFSIAGTASGYADVLSYTAALRAGPLFQDATVLQVADASGSKLGFTVLASIPLPREDSESDSAPE